MSLDIEKIINDCKNNIAESQRKLFYHYYERMAKIVMRYCPDQEDAKEVLNDGFYSVFSNIKTFKGDSQFKTWMTTIFIRESLKKIKINKRIPSKIGESIDENVSNWKAENEDVIDKIEAKELMLLIDNLPELERTVFNLHFLDGYKHKEIAGLCGFSEGTSRWYLNMAKNRIKTNFNNNNYIANKENEITK
ncbi:MAG TPA: sigma-70 family RNA polymerase sigma factor [Bacteroidia bacterium]